MQKYLKKLIAVALVLTMLPFGSIVAMSEGNDATGTDVVDDTASADDIEGDDTEGEDADGEEADDDGLKAPITDEEAIQSCKVAAENDRFIMYYDEAEERVCVYDKDNDYYWWSTGVNAESDASVTETLRLNQKANLILRYGDLEQKNFSTARYSFKESTAKDDTKYELIENGLKITFKYGKNFTVPITFTLNDDGKSFAVACDTTEIIENNISVVDGKVITSLQLTPMMGAATIDDTGYIIVPDGSGAVIKLNNGKQSYNEYSQRLYNRDLTIVPLTSPSVTETAALPTMSMVKGDNALVSIVTEGAGVATAKANVSYQGNSAYNQAYYEFAIRGTDNFYLAGDANAIRVFEKGNIKIPKIEITYFPISAKDGKEVTYVECADVFRNYLIEQQGLTKKTEAGSYDMYVDMYGAVMKQQSILGIPIDLKTEMTTFSQAQDIVGMLQAMGVDDMVVTYNDWTNDEIKGKISTTAKASGTLGGNSDFKKMLSSFESSGIEFYPNYDNMTFTKSSFAFMALTDTAIRVSNSYSRQTEFSRAYGIPNNEVSPALLSPSSYTEVIDKIVKNLSKKNYTNVSFGDYSNTLTSDYAKSSYTNRENTIDIIVEGYKNASETLGSVLADSANDYVIPYVDHITNVSLSSSGYNITDYDIPFYQMVIHGYVPYSTKALNKSADSEELFLLAVASGSAIHYDFIYEESSEIADTDYDGLFYANYKGWLDAASAEYKLANEVLGPVTDQTITGYEINGDVITTTYSNGYVTEVNTNTGDIVVDGRTYRLSDYLTEGGRVE